MHQRQTFNSVLSPAVADVNQSDDQWKITGVCFRQWHLRRSDPRKQQSWLESQNLRNHYIALQSIGQSSDTPNHWKVVGCCVLMFNCYRQWECPEHVTQKRKMEKYVAASKLEIKSLK